ncbi:MAG: hypothetical protein E6R03_03155 [Hyphomicrobiaceae bacterium]|nr:MAG: hypothetical protein E6R03_03155 [Hyphomicrobiaceae bacterium]
MSKRVLPYETPIPDGVNVGTNALTAEGMTRRVLGPTDKSYVPGEVLLPGDVVEVLDPKIGPDSNVRFIAVREGGFTGDTVIGHYLRAASATMSNGVAVTGTPVRLVSTVSLILAAEMRLLDIGDLCQHTDGTLLHFMSYYGNRLDCRCLDVNGDGVRGYDPAHLRYIQKADPKTKAYCQELYTEHLVGEYKSAQKRSAVVPVTTSVSPSSTEPKEESKTKSTRKVFDYVQITKKPAASLEHITTGCFYRVDKVRAGGSLSISGDHGIPVSLPPVGATKSLSQPDYVGFYVSPDVDSIPVNPHRGFKRLLVLTPNGSKTLKPGSMHEILYWSGTRPVVCAGPNLVLGLSNRVGLSNRGVEPDDQLPGLATWCIVTSKEEIEELGGKPVPPNAVTHVVVTNDPSADKSTFVGTRQPIVRWEGSRPFILTGRWYSGGSDRGVNPDSVFGSDAFLWYHDKPEVNASPVPAEPAPEKPQPAVEVKTTPKPEPKSDFVLGDVVEICSNWAVESGYRIVGMIQRPSVIFSDEYVVVFTETGGYGPKHPVASVNKKDLVLLRKPTQDDWAKFHKKMKLAVGDFFMDGGSCWRITGFYNGDLHAILCGASASFKAFPLSHEYLVLSEAALKARFKQVQITGPLNVPNLTIGHKYYVVHHYSDGTPAVFDNNGHLWMLSGSGSGNGGTTLYPGYVYV